MSTLAPAVPSTAALRPPSAVALARARAALELRLFIRETEQVIFSFAYPMVMLVIFGTVFCDQRVSGDDSFHQ